ncbi:hypothetical protein K488DRAFT_55690, partial [Vararia minispora EC-137]
FELEIYWYQRRIRKLLFTVQNTATDAFLTHRLACSSFLRSDAIMRIGDLLSGFHRMKEYDITYCEEDADFAKFKGYIVGKETRMHAPLK